MDNLISPVTYLLNNFVLVYCSYCVITLHFSEGFISFYTELPPLNHHQETTILVLTRFYKTTVSVLTPTQQYL